MSDEEYSQNIFGQTNEASRELQA